jgi:hypothetical protein
MKFQIVEFCCFCFPLILALSAFDAQFDKLMPLNAINYMEQFLLEKLMNA